MWVRRTVAFMRRIHAQKAPRGTRIGFSVRRTSTTTVVRHWLEGDALQLFFATPKRTRLKGVGLPDNLGLHEVMVGEIDVFQLSMQDELYKHMN